MSAQVERMPEARKVARSSGVWEQSLSSKTEDTPTLVMASFVHGEKSVLVCLGGVGAQEGLQTFYRKYSVYSFLYRVLSH